MSNKILTPTEALRAFADGKKLRRADCPPGEFMTLNDGCIVDHLNLSRMVSKFNGLTLYTEPTPKVTWVEYLAVSKRAGCTHSGALYFFQEDRLPTNAMWTYTPTGRKIEV